MRQSQPKAAARNIFFNVAKPGSEYIYLDDLMRFMREDEALKTIRLFEDGSHEQKGINKRDLQNWVMNSLRERRALGLSPDDTKTAVDKLHCMLSVAVGVGSHYRHLASHSRSCNSNAHLYLLTLLPPSFGVPHRRRVEHDYRSNHLFIRDDMVVEEMNILTTVFIRDDNHRVRSLNSVLATKKIKNYNGRQRRRFRQ